MYKWYLYISTYLTGIIGVGEVFKFGSAVMLLAGRALTSIITRVTIHCVENMDDRIGHTVTRMIFRAQGRFLCFALNEEARDRTPHSMKSQHSRRLQQRSVQTSPCSRHSRRDTAFKVFRVIRYAYTIIFSVAGSSGTFTSLPRIIRTFRLKNAKVR